jgi:AraC family L-rhamnose operon regulatory protein RhaS
MSELIYKSVGGRFAVDRCLPQRSAIDAGKVGFRGLSHGHYPGTLIPEEMLPGIASMGFFDVAEEQDWGMEEHRNEGIEICLQETGESDLIVVGVRHRMPPGTLSISRPWQLHQMGAPHLGPGRIHWIIIDVGVRRPNQPWTWPDWCVLTDADLRELTSVLRGNEHPVWAAGTEIQQISRKLGTYVAGADPVRLASHLMVALNQLVLSILELLRCQHLVPDRSLTSRCRTVELFVRELRRSPRMQETNWTLDGMAEICGMGRSSFSDYCHELTNASPIDYLNRCRLETAARRLVNEPDASITAIALESGFSSSQYFCRRFKARYGMTPRAWRKNQA